MKKVFSYLLIEATISAALVPQKSNAAMIWYFSHAESTAATQDQFEQVKREEKYTFIAFLALPLIGAYSAFVSPITIPLSTGAVSAILTIGMLDQKVDSVPQLTATDLVNNGYDASQVTLIENDETGFAKAITDKNAMLTVNSHDTNESVRARIQELYPQASDVYLDLKSEQLALAAQSKLAN